jgi:hypothetical protein
LQLFLAENRLECWSAPFQMQVVTASAIQINGNVAAVDPDHYRRTLIQSDMTQAGKYAYINTGVENNAFVCQQNRGGS